MKIDNKKIEFYYTLDKVRIEEGNRVFIVEMKTRPPEKLHENQLSFFQFQIAIYLWAYERNHGVIPQNATCVSIGSNDVLYELAPDSNRNTLIEEVLITNFINSIHDQQPFIAKPAMRKCKECAVNSFCPSAHNIAHDESEKRKIIIEENIRFQLAKNPPSLPMGKNSKKKFTSQASPS